MAVRKTLDEMIEDMKQKLKAMEEKKKNQAKLKKQDLTKSSEGVADLIAAIDAVAKTHKIAVPEVIKQIARIKRSGLVITNAVRKTKDSA